LLEGAVLFNLISFQANSNLTEPGLSERDAGTSMQRFHIWETALRIITTYPLTGAGMDRFRYAEVKYDFPVVGFDVPDPAHPDESLRPRPPHAHNEFLQLGTDFGIPGLLLYIAIYGTVSFMGYQIWQTGSHDLKVVVAAALAGLFAHAVYGMGDAIPLWDRFAFVFWVLVGIIAACHIYHKKTVNSSKNLKKP
jgi:O-antigen ligase